MRRTTPLLAALALACGPANDDAALPEPPDVAVITSSADAVHRDALRSASDALARSPRSSAAWRELGEALEVASLPREAELCYRAARSLAPDDPRLLYRAAIACAQQGELLRAIETMEDVIAESPGYGPAWRRLGFWRLDMGDVDGARSAMQRTRELLPRRPDGHVGLARVEMRAERAGAAVAAALEALDLAPGAPHVRLVVGEALRLAGREAEAAPHLDAGRGAPMVFADPWSEGLRSVADRDDDLVAQARTAEAQRRFGDALALYDEVLARRPDDADLHYRKGVALLATDRAADAVRHLAEASARFPGNFDLALGHANALRAAGRPAEALGALEAVVARWPDEVTPHVITGELYADAADVPSARAAFARAREIDARDLRSRLFEGRMLLRAGQFAAADEVLSGGLDVPGALPALPYYKLLLAARVRNGATPPEMTAIYERAVREHGDAAREALTKPR